MAYFLLGLCLLIGLLLCVRWFTTTEPKVIASVLKRLLLGLILAAAVFMIVTGRFNWLFYLVPLLLPWLMRFRSLARTAKTFSRMQGGGSGQTSDIRTRYLSLSLDHDTGEMTGQVLEGPFAGKALEDLGKEDLISLLQSCQNDDEQSAQVLAAYLDRLYPDWRASANGSAGARGAGNGGGKMDREEAYQILGLEPGATPEAVKEAHRRLMANLHPDRGGSTYLAAKLNEAKDALLGS